MLANVRDGRLARSPQSLPDAERRRALVQVEIDRIRHQLRDGSRRANLHLSDGDYAEWARRAREALAAFEEEARLLDEWIAPAQRRLLARAYELIKTWQDDLDLIMPEEAAIIAELDAHFVLDSEKKTA